MIIYDDDGIGHNVVPMSVIEGIKNEFINLYPKNYAGGLEIGGSACVFSLNKVLEVFDKHISGK